MQELYDLMNESKFQPAWSKYELVFGQKEAIQRLVCFAE